MLLATAIVTASNAYVCAADDPQFEVHQWSVWAADPSHLTVNGRDHYNNAMAPFVVTRRHSPIRARQGTATPMGVVSFYGAPIDTLSLTLQIGAGAKGQFLAHWPITGYSSQRLRWLGMSLEKEPSKPGSIVYVSKSHWFNQARTNESALYISHGPRTDRFITFDCEVEHPIPLVIAGGPDRYRLANRSNYPLYDVVISVPTEDGRRWAVADVVPPSPAGAADSSTSKSMTPFVAGSAHVGGAAFAAFSPNGAIFATGGADRTVKIWNARTGEMIRNIAESTAEVECGAFSLDGRILAAGGHDRAIRFFDPSTGKTVRTMKGHTGVVSAVAFAPDGRRVATASHDRSVHMWDLRTGRPIFQTTVRTAVNCLDFSRDGRTLAGGTGAISGKSQGALWRWDAQTGQTRGSIVRGLDALTSTACSSDGRLIAARWAKGTIRLYDMATFREVRSFEAPGVQTVAFSRDGKTLLTGSVDGSVEQRRATDGQVIRSGNAHSGAVHAVTVSPDGRVLASVGADGRFALWSLDKTAQSPFARTTIADDEGTELVMPPPVADDNLLPKAEADLSNRLVKAGLVQAEADLILQEHSKAIFSSEMIVCLRLSKEALEETVAMQVYPNPAKTVRVGLMVIRNLNPQIHDELESLITILGDTHYDAREAAEQRLFELGEIAVPALRRAAQHSDPEIVFRAERILQELGSVVPR